MFGVIVGSIHETNGIDPHPPQPFHVFLAFYPPTTALAFTGPVSGDDQWDLRHVLPDEGPHGTASPGASGNEMQRNGGDEFPKGYQPAMWLFDAIWLFTL